MPEFNVPFAAAIEFFRRKVPMPAEEFYKLAAKARYKAFTISTVARMDVVNDLFKSLREHLEKGGTFRDWQKDANEIMIRAGWTGLSPHRLATIYRTNIQGAYQAGHYAKQKEQKDIFPYWMYSAVNDSRTRPAHAANDGVIRRADDPWWDENYPPNGYNCRCTVLALTERQASRRGPVAEGGPRAADSDDWAVPPGADFTPDASKYDSVALAMANAPKSQDTPILGPKEAAEEFARQMKSDPKWLQVQYLETQIATISRELSLLGDVTSAVNQIDYLSKVEAINKSRARLAAIVAEQGEKSMNRFASIINPKKIATGLDVQGTKRKAKDPWREGVNKGASFIEALGLKQLKGLEVSVSKVKTRSRASKNKIWVYGYGLPTIAVIHELGHIVERNNDAVYKALADFHEKRTATDKVQTMASATDARGYRNDEITKVDKFLHPYMGKLYPASYRATELLSMGLEFIYHSPMKLINEDREYLETIIEALRKAQ